MTAAKTIAKNSTFIFLGNAIGAILQLILTAYLVRYLGNIAYGKYAFAFAFTSLFIIFTDLGLSVSCVREIARNRSKAGDYLTNVFVIKLILSFISAISLIIIINIIKYSEETALSIYIVFVISILTSYILSLRTMFRAFERMKFEAISILLEKLLILGLVIPLLILGHGLIKVISVILLAEVIIFILTLIILITKFSKPVLSIDFLLCRSLIIDALPFGMASVFATFIFQIDIIMLSMMKGDEAVGIFSSAYSLVIGLLFIPGAIVGAVYPVLSRCFISSKDSLMMVYEKAFKFLFLLALPLGVGTTLLSEEITLFLYGRDSASNALQVLIWVSSLIFIRSIVGYILASTNRQLVDTRIAGIAALLNVGLNLLLIPMYSYIGAGIASIISQLFLLFFEFNYLQKNGYGISTSRIIYKSLIASAIMGLIVYGLREISLNLLIIIVIAILIYMLSLYILNTFDEFDKKIIRDIFKKSKIIRVDGNES